MYRSPEGRHWFTSPAGEPPAHRVTSRQAALPISGLPGGG
ncbi:MAG: hypothetical protein OJF49_003183 [Ktedonobacterales bacterium]|nr:MAG: hypothetical protein OJF49_003183 [Ktedonobacterales bacterium]